MSSSLRRDPRFEVKKPRLALLPENVIPKSSPPEFNGSRKFSIISHLVMSSVLSAAKKSKPPRPGHQSELKYKRLSCLLKYGKYSFPGELICGPRFTGLPNERLLRL